MTGFEWVEPSKKSYIIVLFYFRLYAGHMDQEKSYTDRGNPLPPFRGIFIYTYHGLCVAFVEHWLEREIAREVQPVCSHHTTSGRSTTDLRAAAQYGITKEENVSFNEALNTFYLWLYGVGHMVKRNSRQREEKPAVLTSWTWHDEFNLYDFTGICFKGINLR